MGDYKVRREVFRITEWKNGEVYRTVSEGYYWLDEDYVKNNKPGETNIIYASPSSEYLYQVNIKRNPTPAVGATKNWKYGYLSCGCRDNGKGEHIR